VSEPLCPPVGAPANGVPAPGIRPPAKLVRVEKWVRGSCLGIRFPSGLVFQYAGGGSLSPSEGFGPVEQIGKPSMG